MFKKIRIREEILYEWSENALNGLEEEENEEELVTKKIKQSGYKKTVFSERDYESLFKDELKEPLSVENHKRMASTAAGFNTGPLESSGSESDSEMNGP